MRLTLPEDADLSFFFTAGTRVITPSGHSYLIVSKQRGVWYAIEQDGSGVSMIMDLPEGTVPCISSYGSYSYLRSRSGERGAYLYDLTRKHFRENNDVPRLDLEVPKA